MNFGMELLVFKFYFRHLLAYPYFNFFIWKMERIIIPTSQNYDHRKLSSITHISHYSQQDIYEFMESV